MSSYTLPSLSDVLSPSVMLELSQRKSLDFGQTQSRKPLSVHDLITPSPKVHQREGAKNKRKRVSPSQLAVLNFTFEQTHFPSLELRMKLGKQLDMTPRAVQIWFQNKRQSIRTREKTINQKCCAVVLLPTAAYLYCSLSLQRYMQYSHCSKKNIRLTSMATSSIKVSRNKELD